MIPQPPEHIVADLRTTAKLFRDRECKSKTPAWRAEYEDTVVMLEYAADEIERLRALEAWVGRMPDAGFNDQDARWGWWHERPQ